MSRRAPSKTSMVVAVIGLLIALAVLVAGLGTIVELPASPVADLASIAWVVAGPHLWLAAAIGVVATVIWWVRARGRWMGAAAIATSAALVVASVLLAQLMLAARAAGGAINPVTALAVSGPAMADTFETTAQPQGIRLRAFIWRTPADTAPTTTLVHVHGGAMVGGASSLAPDADWWTIRGVQVVSLEYTWTTATRAGWDKAPADVGCGLAWLGANASRFGIDPAKLVLQGDSLGGTIALDVAGAASKGKAPNSCADVGQVPAIQAVIASNPLLNLTAVHANDGKFRGTSAATLVGQYLGDTPQQAPAALSDSSPSTHLSAQSPPVLLFNSAADRFVPASTSQPVITELKSKGVRLTTVDVPAAGHVIDGALVNDAMGSQLVRTSSWAWLTGLGLL